jgi:hypothetical protein
MPDCIQNQTAVSEAQHLLSYVLVQISSIPLDTIRNVHETYGGHSTHHDEEAGVARHIARARAIQSSC